MFVFFLLDGSFKQLSLLDCSEMLLCLEEKLICTYVNKLQLIVIGEPRFFVLYLLPSNSENHF